ncbi:MAG: hypothetical protein O7D95_02875 [Betaproteobacteria bacterium]|nr:hypothetical protein [Betaproteobacteria bacterium]
MAIDPRIPLAGGTVIDPSRGINQLIQATQFASQQERQATQFRSQQERLGRLDQRQLDQDAEAKRLRDVQISRINQQITAQGRDDSVNAMVEASLQINTLLDANDIEGARSAALQHKSNIVRMQETNPAINTLNVDRFITALDANPDQAKQMIKGQIQQFEQLGRIKLLADDARSFESSIGKLVSDKELAVEMFGTDSPQAQAIQSAIDSDQRGEPPKLTDVAGVRKEFTKQSSDFIKVRASLNKVLSASDTGPGDVSLIFGFMKIIDPGSTVRESEFATAEQTAGIPERVVLQYNKAIKGDRLSQGQRDNFKAEARNLFNAQLTIQRQLEGVFRGLAIRQNMNPDNVVIDFVGDINLDEQLTTEEDLSNLTTEQLLEMRRQAE